MVFLVVNQVENNSDNVVKSDGRKARSNASRSKIVKAFLQLISEGKISPSAEEVAKISGVGLRTVFRRFNEMELLYRELVPAIEGLFEERIFEALTENNWQAQFNEALIRKCVIYEQSMCYRISIAYHSHHSSFLRGRLEKWQNIEANIHKSILPFDYATNKVKFDSLQAATSPDTWIQLRKLHNLTEEQAFDVMESTADIILKSFIEVNPL